MIEKQEEYSLPFRIVASRHYAGYELVHTSDGNQYLCIHLPKEAYASYLEQTRLSGHISRAVMEYTHHDEHLLLFYYDEHTEASVRKQRTFEITEEVFTKSSFEITLKKEHMIHLNHIYKVLDSRFSYFELRIREIETSPIKNDISWILLSKYNVLLDAKLYLYDLQSDIFKLIDRNMIIHYGLVPKSILSEFYHKGYLLPFIELYYAPKGMLYTRYTLSIGKIPIEKIEKLDLFNQKYYCFMVLYILILNVYLESFLTSYSIQNYLLITKKIKSFIVDYKGVIEGKI